MQINLHVQLSGTYTHANVSIYIFTHMYIREKPYLRSPAAHFIDASLARRCIFQIHVNAR